MELALENNIQNQIVNQNEQNSFLESTLGKVINLGLDAGIRALLPNMIEDQVINIKDEILNNGFKSGVKKAISSAIDLGKSAIGMVTGKFENIEQARTVVKSGGLIDSVSDLLDKGINSIYNSGKISYNTASLIKGGKNVILDTINDNIEKSFDSQINSLEKIGKYTSNWKNYYQEQDFDGMEREYKKIKSTISEVLPIENTIKEARVVENLHQLIKNRGKDFNLSEEEIELANKLIA